jgi:hypothetical protein
MNFETAFISCSAYAVGVYSACCPDIAKNRLFPIPNKPSLFLEKHMSPNPESENIRKENCIAHKILKICERRRLMST